MAYNSETRSTALRVLTGEAYVWPGSAGETQKKMAMEVLAEDCDAVESRREERGKGRVIERSSRTKRIG